MDIHAPHKPILTLQEAAVHLGIVTIGILIALSLEGILERVHHHALVAEARANIRAELHNNEAALTRLLGELPPMRKRLETGLETMNALPGDAQQASRLFAVGPGGLVYSYDIAELSTASRTTAEVTGAFGLMDYAEVKTYAAAYHRQALYNKTQDTAFGDAMSDVMSAFALGQHLDFQRATAGEIEELKQHIRLAIGNLIVQEEVGTALSAAYRRALGEEHP